MTYTPPTPEELRAILARFSLSRTQAAALLDVSPRALYRWLSGDRDMAYAYLYTLLSRASGLAVEPDTWRDAA